MAVPTLIVLYCGVQDIICICLYIGTIVDAVVTLHLMQMLHIGLYGTYTLFLSHPALWIRHSWSLVLPSSLSPLTQRMLLLYICKQKLLGPAFPTLTDRTVMCLCSSHPLSLCTCTHCIISTSLYILIDEVHHGSGTLLLKLVGLYILTADDSSEMTTLIDWCIQFILESIRDLCTTEGGRLHWHLPSGYSDAIRAQKSVGAGIYSVEVVLSILKLYLMVFKVSAKDVYVKYI